MPDGKSPGAWAARPVGTALWRHMPNGMMCLSAYPLGQEDQRGKRLVAVLAQGLEAL